MNTYKLLKEREAKGLVISIYSHFVALIIFFVLTIAVDANPIYLYLLIIIATAGSFGLLLIPLKKERWIDFSGIFIANIDTIAISTLPFIWHNISGADVTPKSYLVKTYTFYLISAIIICVNGIALRPLFIGISTIGVMIVHGILLFLVIADPNTVFTENWKDTFLSEKVNLKIQFNMIIMVGMLGGILMLITRSARKTIIKGIELEKINSQFGRYFSPNVREELSKAQEEFFRPGGKLQEVTILFSDIRSFTSISEEIGVEGTLALLAEYQKAMVETIFLCNGTLDKFIGDGILASFGTPKPKAGDANNALQCAIQMQLEIRKINEKRKILKKKEIQVGIGIHSGLAIVGNIGSEERLEYTVIGDTVNTASRVEAMTKELREEILFTNSVVEKLTDNFPCEYVGEFTLRGKKEKTRLYKPNLK